jgi:Ca-activated chloride channel family protein
MRTNLSLMAKTGFRLILFCWLTLALISFARTQSADDVHIIPRADAKKHVPTSDTVPIAGPDGPVALHAHARPFRVDVDLVLVPVTVTDAMERPAMALTKRDFALYENGKLQEIRYFSEETAPVSIALLVDVSKSMTDKIDTERAAIVEFFKNACPQDEYFAITFSDRPRLVASSTQSIDELETKLSSVEPGGPTAMLDAVYMAQAELRSARYKRKAILIISDGGDNVSRYTLREIKQLAQESDVQIYAIGLFETFFFNTIEERLGKKWLREITDATGGRTITVDNHAKLPEAAAELSREIRSEYVLGYRPVSPVPNRWQKVKVRITSSSGEHPLRAYYKQGYLTGAR